MEKLTELEKELLEALEWAFIWIALPSLKDYNDFADHLEAQREWADNLKKARIAQVRAKDA